MSDAVDMGKENRMGLEDKMMFYLSLTLIRIRRNITRFFDPFSSAVDLF